MFLVDSDYDTEDEEYGDDIEEILSGQIVNSAPSDDEHDDLCAQVRALPNSPKKISNPFKRQMHHRTQFNDCVPPSQISERRNKKRKEMAAKLFDEDASMKN